MPTSTDVLNAEGWTIINEGAGEQLVQIRAGGRVVLQLSTALPDPASNVGMVLAEEKLSEIKVTRIPAGHSLYAKALDATRAVIACLYRGPVEDDAGTDPGDGGTDPGDGGSDPGAEPVDPTDPSAVYGGKLVLGKTAQNVWFINRIASGDITGGYFASAYQTELTQLAGRTNARLAWFPAQRRAVIYSQGLIQYSNDYGVTWNACTVIGGGIENPSVGGNQVRPHGQGAFILSGSKKCHYSRDGVKWIEITPTGFATSIRIVGTTVYATDGTQLYTTPLGPIVSAWSAGTVFSPTWTQVGIGSGIAAAALVVSPANMVLVHESSPDGAFSAQGSNDLAFAQDGSITGYSGAPLIDGDFSTVTSAFMLLMNANYPRLYVHRVRPYAGGDANWGYYPLTSANSPGTAYSLSWDEAQDCFWLGGTNFICKVSWPSFGSAPSISRITVAQRAYYDIIPDVEFV